MALTPEDGTGLANADSYVSLAEFKTYADARGIDYSDFDDTQLEGQLRSAFAYVNNYGIWKSVPKVNDQAGEFPRIDLSDGMGRIFNVVPQRVKDAQCEAALVSGVGGVDLNVVSTNNIASETVGPISTSYFQGTKEDTKTYFQAIDGFLKPFLRDPNCPRQPLPSYNDYDGSDPIFSVGMDDNAAEQG